MFLPCSRTIHPRVSSWVTPIRNSSDSRKLLDAFNQTIRIKPDYAGAHYHIGWIYNEQKNYDDAVKSLKLALRYNASYAEAHNELGFALRNLSRNPEAIAEYQEAIRLKPDMGLAHLGLADVYYFNTKQYAEAAKSYKQGLTLRPGNATAQYNLGWCYNDLGRYNEAIEELRESYPVTAHLS